MQTNYLFLLIMAVIVLVLCCFITENNKPNDIISSQIELKRIPKEVQPITNSILFEINDKNEQIKTLVYPKIVIKSHGISLDSTLFYEKPQRFRSVSWSVLGKESDVGSNDDIFWFWSKRMNPPALFYTKHENLYNTRLRAPFHPEWSTEILGCNAIKLDKCTVMEYKNQLVLFEERTSIIGKPLVKIWTVDPHRKSINGHYLYDVKMNPIISAEIKDFHVFGNIYLPKTMEINWYEESVKTVWEMDRPIVNVPIDSVNWKIPDVKKSIDLNGYIP